MLGTLAAWTWIAGPSDWRVGIDSSQGGSGLNAKTHSTFRHTSGMNSDEV